MFRVNNAEQALLLQNSLESSRNGGITSDEIGGLQHIGRSPFPIPVSGRGKVTETSESAQLHESKQIIFPQGFFSKRD